MTVDFSLLSASFQDDPWSTFAALRDRCPLHQTDQPAPHYTLSLETDVRAVLRDDGTWSSRFGPGLSYADPAAPNGVLVSSDPPLHTDERLAISRLFKPSAIEAMGPDIERLVDTILDGLAPRGEGDLIADLAMPVPLTVMCWMLGTPVTDIDKFRSWVMPMAEGVSSPDGRLLPYVADAYRNFIAYFGDHVARRTGRRRGRRRRAGRPADTAPHRRAGWSAPQRSAGARLLPVPARRRQRHHDAAHRQRRAPVARAPRAAGDGATPTGR